MSETTWRKVSETEWYGPGWGTVSKRADGWWGSNSTSASVDVEPTVGPFPTAKEARYALGHAMTRWRAEKRAFDAHERGLVVSDEEKPLFRHDCDKCTFLGRHAGHDLYFCPQGGLVPTVIARFGDDGPDYVSGLPLADAIPEIAEAKRRAKEKGLLP